jgi:hypothetical protein
VVGLERERPWLNWVGRGRGLFEDILEFGGGLRKLTESHYMAFLGEIKTETSRI